MDGHIARIQVDSAAFSSVVVPNVSTAQLDHLLSSCQSSSSFPVVGPTGTGKSAFVNSLIYEKLPQRSGTRFHSHFPQTTAAQTQDIIDGKLGRKGVFGPAEYEGSDICRRCQHAGSGGVRCPASIELLRTFLANNGWYDLKDKSSRTLVDTQLIAAMGPPGGGGTNDAQIHAPLQYSLPDRL